jgi:hypothetical protein
MAAARMPPESDPEIDNYLDYENVSIVEIALTRCAGLPCGKCLFCKQF